MPGAAMDAGLEAARGSRVALARVIELLETSGHGDVRTTLTKAIAQLYSVEVAGREPMVQHLTQAIEHIREALALLQAAPEASDMVQHATEGVARCLTVLHPATASLRGASADEPTVEPIPLELRRHASTRNDERRDDARITVKVDLGYQSESNFYTGFTNDVSQGGLFVATYDLLQVGTELVVSFLIPHGPQLTLRGRVRWIRQANTVDTDLHPGMGVQFLSLTTEQRQAIARFQRIREPMFVDD